MTTSEFIKLIQEADPSGNMKIVANCSRFDYPVGFGTPEIGYITKKLDWADQDDIDDIEEGEIEFDDIEKVISVRVDN